MGSTLAPAAVAHASTAPGDRITPTATIQETARTDSLKSLADSLMAGYDRQDSPGATVAVIRGGEVAFSRAYGMADLTHRVPNSVDTKFNLGSASKQFMGYAFALLAERGQLSLDDPVSEHLPDWPEFEETVTLRHVLTHTSGYREAYGTLALTGRLPDRDYLAREEALEVVRRQPMLEFPAGSEHEYNSTAYVILAEIADRVTDQPIIEWMQQNVFDPLEMEHTTIESEVGQIIPGAAYSYGGSEEGGYRMGWSNRALFGGADVYTTVGDLAKWFRSFRTAGLGGQSVMERMTKRFVLTSGDTTDYALGLYIDEHRGLRRMHHGGSHAGYQAHLSYYPEIDAGVVVLGNYSGVRSGRVANQVAEFAFAEHMEPEEEEVQEPAEEEAQEPEEEEAQAPPATAADSSDLAEYAGRYYSPELGATYTLRVEGESLVAEHRFVGRMPLKPLGEADQFRTFWGTVRFDRNDVDLVTGFYATIARTSDVWFAKRD